MEVLMFTDVGAKGQQVSPSQASSGPSVPTKFAYTQTFSLDVREPGADEGTDWGMYGRYALLAVLIVALMFLVLWSGRDRRPRDVEDDGVEEDPEVAERRERLERKKDKVMGEIKELDERHENGEIGEGVWKRKRRSLKNRAVEVMRELDDLGSGGGASGDGLSEELQEVRDLEREKKRVLDRIRELDARHEDGDLDDDEWKRQRNALKGEAVILMKRMKELEEG